MRSTHTSGAGFYGISSKLAGPATAVDVGKCTRKVWLVKVPRLVAGAWRSAPAGTNLAEISNEPEVDGRHAIMLLEPPAAPTIPRSFTLAVTKSDVKQIYVFSADPKRGCAESIEGQVVREAVMVPVINEEYRRISKDRTARAAVPEKSTKYVGREELARAKGMGYALLSTDTTFASKYLKARSADYRKERIPQKQLIHTLLALFREYPYWSLKALTERTQQPQLYLKEILLSVAHLNKRGPYLGMYSLLPEHQAGNKESNKGSAPEENSAPTKDETPDSDGDVPM